MIVLYLILTAIAGYLLGSINFARIFAWHFGKKDITKIGSHNPGTMNMLRTRGFGEALLTLIFEAIKVGAPALALYFVFKTYLPGYENLAYFISSIAGIIGHCYPIFYGFKGGKGVACTFGMFVFHPMFWWISLIVFVVCFLLFFVVPFPFIVSFTFILTLSIYSTCIFTINNLAWWIIIIVLLWVNIALIVFKHRGNIKRLIAGKENKVDLKEKLFKKKKSVVEAGEEKTEAEKGNDKTTTD